MGSQAAGGDPSAGGPIRVSFIGLELKLQAAWEALSRAMRTEENAPRQINDQNGAATTHRPASHVNSGADSHTSSRDNRVLVRMLLSYSESIAASVASAASREAGRSMSKAAALRLAVSAGALACCMLCDPVSSRRLGGMRTGGLSKDLQTPIRVSLERLQRAAGASHGGAAVGFRGSTTLLNALDSILRAVPRDSRHGIDGRGAIGGTGTYRLPFSKHLASVLYPERGLSSGSGVASRPRAAAQSFARFGQGWGDNNAPCDDGGEDEDDTLPPAFLAALPSPRGTLVQQHGAVAAAGSCVLRVKFTRLEVVGRAAEIFPDAVLARVTHGSEGVDQLSGVELAVLLRRWLTRRLCPMRCIDDIVDAVRDGVPLTLPALEIVGAHTDAPSNDKSNAPAPSGAACTSSQSQDLDRDADRPPELSLSSSPEATVSRTLRETRKKAPATVRLALRPRRDSNALEAFSSMVDGHAPQHLRGALAAARWVQQRFGGG